MFYPIQLPRDIIARVWELAHCLGGELSVDQDKSLSATDISFVT